MRRHRSRDGKRAAVHAVGAASAVAVACALGLGGCDSEAAGQDEATEPPAQAVRVIQVESRPLRQTADYVGTVEAAQQVAVSGQLRGTLASLPVREGDPVVAGQVLARIDAPEVAARGGQTRAEVYRARRDREHLCGQAETDVELARDGVIAQAQLEASRTKCEMSQAALDAARARAAELDATLGKGVVRAPLDGYVLDRLAEPGEEVGPGRTIVLLGANDFEITVPVVEVDLHRGVSESTRALLELPPQGSEPLEVQVAEVAPLATGAGRSAEVTLPLAGERSLRHGMSVDVRLVLREIPDATPVPLGALSRAGAEHAVFVVKGDRAQRVEVERGIAADGWVSVEPRLPEGAQVAVSNLDVLVDGARVYPVPAPGGR